MCKEIRKKNKHLYVFNIFLGRYLDNEKFYLGIQKLTYITLISMFKH